MPIYEYKCDACNHQFDLRQKFSDPPAERCPKCGGLVRKMVSSVSFSLKGGGWHGDGYDTKTEGTTSESDTAAGTGNGAEAAPKDVAPAAVAVSPATAEAASSPKETKGTVAETPASTAEKATS